MRLGEVVLAYFMIGSLMWAGGAIIWQDAGVGTLLINVNDSSAEPKSETGGLLESLGGPIKTAAQAAGAVGLLAIWNVLVKLIAFLFWPIVVLLSVNAPTEGVVIAGGGMVVAFFMAVLRLVRGSA